MPIDTLSKFNHAQLIIRIHNSFNNIERLTLAFATADLGEHPYWKELDDFGKRLNQMIDCL